MDLFAIIILVLLNLPKKRQLSEICLKNNLEDRNILNLYDYDSCDTQNQLYPGSNLPHNLTSNTTFYS